MAEGFELDLVLAKVAAVESRSEHPIARAIVEAALGKEISLPALTEFDSITGMGVRATVDGERVEVGADRFMRELGLISSIFQRLRYALETKENRHSMLLLMDVWLPLSQSLTLLNQVRRLP